MKKVLVRRLVDPRKLLSLGETEQTKSGYVELKLGEVMPLHVTKAREEVILILRGKAKITVEGKECTVGSREVVYIPPEMAHEVENIGKEKLEYVYVVSMINS